MKIGRALVFALVAALACFVFYDGFAREGFQRSFAMETQEPIETDAMFVTTDADLLLGSAYRNLPADFSPSYESAPYEPIDDSRASLTKT